MQQPEYKPPGYQQPGYQAPIPSPYEQGPYSGGPMVNTSGQGAAAVIPPEVAMMGFNWGAFLLNWIWGVGNSVWISLLMWVFGFLNFIPGLGLLAGLGFQIYLGIKGNELAWRNRRFESIEQFRAVQATWTKWSLILLVAGFVLGILGAIAIMSSGGFQRSYTTSPSTSFSR